MKDYITNDDHFTRKTSFPQDKFLNLVNSISTTITFHSQFHQQTNDIAMGRPASSITAEI